MAIPHPSLHICSKQLQNEQMNKRHISTLLTESTFIWKTAFGIQGNNKYCELIFKLKKKIQAQKNQV